jgi:hypothetical protein
MSKDQKTILLLVAIVVLSIMVNEKAKEEQLRISSDYYLPGLVMTSLECKEGEDLCTITEKTRAYFMHPAMLMYTAEEINVRSIGFGCPVVKVFPFMSVDDLKTIDQGACREPYNEVLP